LSYGRWLLARTAWVPGGPKPAIPAQYARRSDDPARGTLRGAGVVGTAGSAGRWEQIVAWARGADGAPCSAVGLPFSPA
jgi:hypothetical protein